MRTKHSPEPPDHVTDALQDRGKRLGGIPVFVSAALTILGMAALTLSMVFAGQAAARAPASVAPAATNAPRISGAIVVDWNKALLHILGTPGAQPASVHPTRSLAMLHAAMYDAVVSITRASPPYLFSLNAPAGARPDAAAAQAGHDTLAALYPALTAALDGQLSEELSAIPDGTAKQEGTQVGHLAAAFILAERANDGSAAPPPPFVPGTEAGTYRPTPPFVNGAAFTNWPAVTPFVLARGNQFRSAPPPSLSSDTYAAAVNEVKSLGAANSSTRTTEQTVLARFWSAPIWTTWNEIAERSALSHRLDLAQTARLFALLNLSFADTAIAFYDAKYHYNLWRPATAIREAASARNPAVAADPSWVPLLTAADPSYPGAHSAVSAAAAAILTSFFGKRDKIAVTSDVLPGTVRSFDSYSAAATEAGLSRIYGGVHTRLDHDAGLQLGEQVAAFVLRQSMTRAFGLQR